MAFSSVFSSALLVQLLFWHSTALLSPFLDVPENFLDVARDSTQDRPMDCAEIQERNNASRSGVYIVWPRNRVMVFPISVVYCDFEEDGGGWTVIQRRGDFGNPEDYFYRNWFSYQIGFGKLREDFWQGNDQIYALTNQRATSVKFTLEDFDGNVKTAFYDDFYIDDGFHNYTLHVSGYRGDAGDSFGPHNELQFSTRDRDNDHAVGSCAETFKGAWWYGNCHLSNLNGNYLKGPHDSFADGVNWYTFRGFNYSLKNVVIKIRPKNFGA